MTVSGIKFVQVRHDAWCRAPFTQRATDCVCNAQMAVVDEATWAAGVDAMNRARRRAAERAARRAAKGRAR